MSEISAEISAIFRVSEAIEAKFETLSRSLEKSPKIGKYRRYIGEISVFGRYFGGNFGHVEATRGANFCGIFWEIYRRYIVRLLVWLRSDVQKSNGPDHASFSNGYFDRSDGQI